MAGSDGRNGHLVPQLGELCSLIVDSEHKTAPKDPDGLHPLVRTSNLKLGRADFDGAQRVNAETYALWTRRAAPREGDLILAREAPVGGIGRVPAEVHPVLGQRTVLLRPCPEVVDGRYLMYRLAAPDLQARMSEMATGATVPHLNMADIRAFRVPDLPDLDEQRRRSALLAAFDDLIQINERQIELLEDLARSLYREWFERFRFPGHGVVPSGDAAPEGWRRAPASQLFVINPRLKTTQDVMAKVTMADVDERTSAVFPSDQVTRAAGSRFERDDVLFARITPCLENGKTALVKFLESGEIAVGSTEFIVLRGARVGPAFTYCAARSNRLREHAIKSMSGATGRQRVATDCFDSLKLAEPPHELASRFEDSAGPMLDQVFALARLNRRLARTRDLLLPRLVTGRLDISNVDLRALLLQEDA